MNTSVAPAAGRHWRSSLLAAAIHLGLSAIVAAAVAALMFGVWFPTPYRQMLGGDKLFVLIAWVDVSLGPLLTLVAFDTRKPRGELARDLTIIGLLQLAALAYGSWTLVQARPAHLAFEVDLYRIVTVADIDPAQLGEAPPALRGLPWSGPTLIGVRKPTVAQEVFDTVLMSTRGVQLAYLPRYWQPYAAVTRDALARSKPLAALPVHNDLEREALARALARSGLSREQARWLPVLSARASWIAIGGIL